MASKKYLVLAGNHTQFLTWCKENRLSPYADACYCAKVEDTLGRHPRDTVVVRVGNYWCREDFFEIAEHLIRHGFDPYEARSSK